MRKTFLRVMYFAVLATIICIGCGGDDGQTKSLLAGDLLNAITGGRGTDTPVVDIYTLSIIVSPTEGGTVSRSPNASSYAPGTQVTVTATPKTEAGYEFIGWSGDSNSEESSITITMNGSMALSAGFRRIGADFPKYSVYFNPNGATGTPPETIQRDSAAVVLLPNQAGLTKEWHRFAGWNTEADGSGRNYNTTDEYTFTQTATLFAKWTRDTYTLTINAATGGTTSPNPGQTTYNAGTDVTVIATAAQDYTFTGWSGATNTINATVTVRMDGNKELTPNFKQNTYTLTTNISTDGGGTVSRNPDANSYSPGTEVRVTATPAQGYTFTGWSGASNSTNTTVTIRMDENKVLTAGFGRPNVTKFTVTFNGNGAMTGSAPTEIWADSGAAITLPGQGSLERNGYKFGWWTTNSSGTGTKYNTGDSYRVISGSTLFAKWVPIYTVTFNGNSATNGSVPAAATADSGVTIMLPGQESLERSGYSFDGWNENNASTGTSYAANSSYIVKGNVTFYAKWKANTYTLTINANPSNGGTFSRSPDQANYNYGTNVTVTATPNPGYTFTGWSGAASETANPVTIVMDDNKTLTANFQQIPYSVTVSSVGAGASNNGSYVAGTTVTITAGTAPSGYVFKNWTTTSGGVTFANANSATTTFIMPTNTVTVTANFVTGITDVRDGKTYRTVKIGSQTWMAENLNYQPLTGNSWCYNNSTDNCNKYGRLYDWSTAMGISTSYNSQMWWDGSDVKRQGVCPTGWHLPSRSEWDTLVTYAGGDVAGKKLKSQSGWNSYSGISSTDEYGFSALPGGLRNGSRGDFYDYAGKNGFWWTATESFNYAYNEDIDYRTDFVGEIGNLKSEGFSVRCLEDERQ
jgi:uncharacterized protein (TIGR02145 family)/uncharacterized repeat protein (TIGR02543 family)